jgi:hypothetical protein
MNLEQAISVLTRSTLKEPLPGLFANAIQAMAQSMQEPDAEKSEFLPNLKRHLLQCEEPGDIAVAITAALAFEPGSAVQLCSQLTYPMYNQDLYFGDEIDAFCYGATLCLFEAAVWALTNDQIEAYRELVDAISRSLPRALLGHDYGTYRHWWKHEPYDRGTAYDQRLGTAIKTVIRRDTAATFGVTPVVTMIRTGQASRRMIKALGDAWDNDCLGDRDGLTPLGT